MPIASDMARNAVWRLIDTLQKTIELHPAKIDQSFDLISNALDNGRTIFTCGNGGSFASSIHFIAELVGRYKVERGPLQALALGSNPSTITAIGNDYGYEQIFERELRGLAKPGDVFIALTTSGKSPNILRALAACNELGVSTVVLTGSAGAHLEHSTDCTIAVPSSETARVQEVHDLIIHIWCEALDHNLTKGE